MKHHRGIPRLDYYASLQSSDEYRVTEWIGPGNPKMVKHEIELYRFFLIIHTFINIYSVGRFNYMYMYDNCSAQSV